ncbi:MAG: OsmC family protein [Thermodesulfovibrionia bacterium]|nr:OsmC family protein [Thermodesulfovibrionia bacterium]
MEDKELTGLKESLKGWKEKVPFESKGFLTWEKDLVFTARIRGYQFEYDPKAMEGCWPTDTLLMSLAGCLGIDVVMFLQKMKAEIKEFEIETSGERNPAPPQYYKSIKMVIHISGKGITPKKLDRAIALSQEKYCSVYHSLRKDIEVTVSYEIKEDA